MIELSGFRPEEDIAISFTGLRPGEKLYEEPIHEMENVEPTVHSKLRRLRNNRKAETSDICRELAGILSDPNADDDRIKVWLASKIPEYRRN
jgi:FlaA1/EpsC-like NDP-sugar epimerase